MTTRKRARLGARAVTRTHHSKGGIPDAELWVVHGGGHAWAGGSSEATYTDSGGPDASREMVRFFLQHRLDGRNIRPRNAETVASHRGAATHA
jgi:poly(3-hydroxybutyrate) depolymerase